MSINLIKEELYSLRDLVQFVPRSTRTSRHIHRSAIYRWAQKGLLSRDRSRRVVLETIRAGGSLCSSKEALQRFFYELSKRSSPQDGSSESTYRDGRKSTSTTRLSDVDRQLDEYGF